MSKTIISDCTCEHAYQDQTYGKSKRVFNSGMKQSACTVCGKTKGITVAETKKDKEKK